MNGFEQLNMNMIAHNRVLLEIGCYILPVDVYVVFGNGSELESNHHYHFQNNSVSFIIDT
jgi:hypothetical protein